MHSVALDSSTGRSSARQEGCSQRLFGIFIGPIGWALPYSLVGLMRAFCHGLAGTFMWWPLFCFSKTPKTLEASPWILSSSGP